MYKIVGKSILSTACLALMLSGCGGKKKIQSPQASQQGLALNKDSVEYFQKNVGDAVYFDFDKSNLSPEAKATLAKQAAWLKEHPQYLKGVVVSGYCDAAGTEEYNMALGARRSHEAKKVLSASGIASVKTTSLGKKEASNIGDGSKDRKAVTTIGASK